MAPERNYAPLPYEYLEEMDELNDAEFGRLARALLRYSMTGEPIALSGNERFYAKRVMLREDRFRESFANQSATRSQAGRNAANTRWKNHDTDAYKGNAENANAYGRTASNAKNANTNTKAEAETNTETKANSSGSTPLPPASGGKAAAAAGDDSDFAKAVRELLNYIPQLSPPHMDAFKAFYASLGADVCVMAVYEAREAGVNGGGAWRYVKSVLERCERSNIRSLAAWDADQAARRQRGSESHGRTGSNSPAHAGEIPEKDNKWGIQATPLD